ncbi:MAG: hypothetical protein K940chlam5_00673 [Candidatus Anoxychlamydiales bacterium]|nr:hypothetical protein [Candidatus Anoxychlamydiales bacterium]
MEASSASSLELKRTEVAENATPNQDLSHHDLMRLPEDLLLQIFTFLPSELRAVSLVCRKFNALIFRDDKDRFWRLFANSIGLKKIPDSTYLESCHLMMDEKRELKSFISQITKPFDKAQAQIDLVEAQNQNFRTKIELVKAYLNENEIRKAKELISQITNPYIKAKAQIELVKLIPSENEIREAKELISQLTDPLDKAHVQIELVKLFFLNHIN